MLRAERDIRTKVCLVRLYCRPLRMTETAKFLVVREPQVPSPFKLNKRKKMPNSQFGTKIFLSFSGGQKSSIYAVILEKVYEGKFHL